MKKHTEIILLLKQQQHESLRGSQMLKYRKSSALIPLERAAGKHQRRLCTQFKKVLFLRDSNFVQFHYIRNWL